MSDLIDRTWHLATSKEDMRVTDFELQLWRVVFGFIRWQEDCEQYINNIDLSADDLSVLHIIRMSDRAKTVYDIGRLLNRDDTFSINYSIRKLLKLGLIEKANTVKKMVTYQITQAGIEDTDTYSEARRNILIELYKNEPDLKLEELAKALSKIKGIYDEAAIRAASYKKDKK